jgi:hypothetical protein
MECEHHRSKSERNAMLGEIGGIFHVVELNVRASIYGKPVVISSSPGHCCPAIVIKRVIS